VLRTYIRGAYSIRFSDTQACDTDVSVTERKVQQKRLTAFRLGIPEAVNISFKCDKCSVIVPIRSSVTPQNFLYCFAQTAFVVYWACLVGAAFMPDRGSSFDRTDTGTLGGIETAPNDVPTPSEVGGPGAGEPPTLWKGSVIDPHRH